MSRIGFKVLREESQNFYRPTIHRTCTRAESQSIVSACRKIAQKRSFYLLRARNDVDAVPSSIRYLPQPVLPRFRRARCLSINERQRDIDRWREIAADPIANPNS